MSHSSPSPVEGIKSRSRHLRGTIAEGLEDAVTGALREDDTHLVKFHGIYQQDDRDVRAERRAQRLEPAYQFMVRARIPGGICTAAQWLAMDAIACTWANHTLRITTRQTFQFHGILKRNLKSSIAAINQALLDTLAACGDVNRNVVGTTLAFPPAIRAQVAAVCRDLSDRLLPRTRAYHEIWLDGAQVVNTADDAEPLYGETYLPRKFKIGVAVPPDNDIDVFAQDLGFIAIVDRDKLLGFNVTVGGGLGMTHGEFATYPRLGDVLGFCRSEQALRVAEAVITVQRDLGDRTDRRHARLKYTIDTLGLAHFRAEVESRLGESLEPARPFRFAHNGDHPGWREEADGTAHCTVHLASGRVQDDGDRRALSGLRAIAAEALATFHLTANQNVVLADIAPARRARVAQLLAEHGIDETAATPTRARALACVGLPTCGLAMAESERYLETFVSRLESLQRQYGLSEVPVTLRITGCPNGCARPFLAEVALVGKAPGRYNLHLGGAFDGTRLNAPYAESLDEDAILATLAPLLENYARGRNDNERFGDFLVRTGVVPALTVGREFAAAARALAERRSFGDVP
ncbi:MAG: NADPH-dependent assimilatory sulfite reductase hemoprotein subunit [Gammaproteobacteria bacterium]